MRTRIDRHWDYRLRHPFWRLYRNHAHGAELRSTAGTVRIQPERMYLIPSLCEVHGRCRGALVHDFCHFSLVGLPMHRCPSWARAPVVLPADAGLLERFDRAMADDPATGHFAVQACILLALQQAVALLPPAERDALLRWQESQDVWDLVSRTIEERIGEDLGVEGLASMAGWSPDHFSRRFRSAFGMPPARYVRERRCARAAELLLGDDEPIGSIAQLVGFQNRYHFSQVFKAVMGIPPAAFRHQARIRRPDQEAV